MVSSAYSDYIGDAHAATSSLFVCVYIEKDPDINDLQSIISLPAICQPHHSIFNYVSIRKIGTILPNPVE